MASFRAPVAVIAGRAMKTLSAPLSRVSEGSEGKVKETENDHRRTEIEDRFMKATEKASPAPPSPKLRLKRTTAPLLLRSRRGVAQAEPRRRRCMILSDTILRVLAVLLGETEERVDSE